MRLWRIVLGSLLLAPLGLLGCDQNRIAKLEEGVSTEAQVRAAFGEPLAVHAEPGGARTLEYTRQPEGTANYMITIGPDGVMSALRQVLAPPYFARVRPGMTREEVRRLLGKPAKEWEFPLKQESVWDWRWRDGQQGMMFSATFDAQGRVLHAASAIDPREIQQGGY